MCKMCRHVIRAMSYQQSLDDIQFKRTEKNDLNKQIN